MGNINIQYGRSVFDTEINALLSTKSVLGVEFDQICNAIDRCVGKIAFVGVKFSNKLQLFLFVILNVYWLNIENDLYMCK